MVCKRVWGHPNEILDSIPLHEPRGDNTRVSSERDMIAQKAR